MDLAQYKDYVKHKNTRNYKFVKIRSLRACHHCGKLLTPGTECLTINNRTNHRRWQCEDCVIAKLNVVNARAFKASIAFGDEGGYMAAQEWEDEALSDWYERGNN